MISQRSSTTIYIVDDDVSVRRALKRLFLSEGFVVVTFESAEEFLEQATIQESSCLVLDLHLRGMNGLELLETLKKHDRSIPAVVITAHDEQSIRDKVLKLGAEFLVKPIKEEALLGAVSRAI